MDILSDYEVQFYIMWGKMINTKYTWLTAYINDYKELEEVQKFLDEHIYTVINREIERGGEITESQYFADINILETKIYKDARAWQNDNAIEPDLIIPTLHFTTIFEAWRDYSLIYG